MSSASRLAVQRDGRQPVAFRSARCIYGQVSGQGSGACGQAWGQPVPSKPDDALFSLFAPSSALGTCHSHLGAAARR